MRSFLGKAIVGMLIVALIASLTLGCRTNQGNIHNLNSRFLRAIRGQQFEEVMDLINQGADVNVFGDDGKSGLHIAAEADNTKIVKLLLTAGAKINIYSRDNRTINVAGPRCRAILRKQIKVQNRIDIELIDAIDKGDVETVKAVIKRGGNVNAAFDIDLHYPMSPLHAVLYSPKSFPILRILVKEGVDWKPFEGALLTIALDSKDVAFVKHCLQLGCSPDKSFDFDIEPPDGGGYGELAPELPIEIAIDQNNVEFCKVLIEGGAKVNYGNEFYVNGSPLHQATILDQAEITELLLNAGADVSCLNDDGKKPVDVAGPKSKALLEAHQKKQAENKQ